MNSIVSGFISRHWSVSEAAFSVDVQPLHGGLEASVARARISANDRRATVPAQLVVTQLPVGGSPSWPARLNRRFRRPPMLATPRGGASGRAWGISGAWSRRCPGSAALCSHGR
jgi:hypothetical protein